MKEAFIFYDCEDEFILNVDYNRNGCVVTKEKPEKVHPYSECLFCTSTGIESLVKLSGHEHWPENINKDSVVILLVEFDDKKVYIDYSNIVWEFKEGS